MNRPQLALRTKLAPALVAVFAIVLNPLGAAPAIAQETECPAELGGLLLASETRIDDEAMRLLCSYEPAEAGAASRLVLIATYAPPGSEVQSPLCVAVGNEQEEDPRWYGFNYRSDVAAGVWYNADDHALGVDRDAVRAGAAALLAQIAPLAADCSVLAAVTSTTTSTTSTTSTTTSTTTTSTTTTTTVPPTSTTVAVGVATEPDSPSGNATADRPDTATPAGDGGSTVNTLTRAITIGAVALTVLGLLLAVRAARKQARIRTWLDLARLAITVAAVLFMSLAMAVATPGWLAGGALALGVLIGLLQGWGVEVHPSPRGLVARRTPWGIGFWALGIITAQVAGMLNRASLVRVGLGLSFLSIGLVAGLVIGRSGPIRQARRATGVPAMASFLLLALIAGGLLLAPTQPSLAHGPGPGETALLSSVRDQAAVHHAAGTGFGLHAQTATTQVEVEAGDVVTAVGQLDFEWGQQMDDEATIAMLGDKSEIRMALEGMHRDAAWLAQQAGEFYAGPYMGKAAKWLVENPELPIRFAAGWATAGTSEIVLAPMDLIRSLQAAQEQKMAEVNRDLTLGEEAWEVGKAALLQIGGYKLGKYLSGPPRADVALPRINRMQRSFMPEAPPPPRNIALRKLAPGEAVPPQLIPQTGLAPGHLDEVAKFTRSRNVGPVGRTGNPHSYGPMRSGEAVAKRLGVKPKTINDIDVHLGAKPEHRGTAGLFQPKMPDKSKMSNMTEELVAKIKARHAERVEDFGKHSPEIPTREALSEGDTIYRQAGRVFDAKTGKPFGSDFDLVYLKDAKTGEVIRGQRYRDLIAEMQDRGLIEHGAELNMVEDVLRAQGLKPGVPGFREGVGGGMGFDEAIKLRTKLEGATVFCDELVVEMGTDGVLRMGPSQRDLMGLF